MKNKIEKNNFEKTKEIKKKQYNKPKLKSEKITMFGALCNGSSSGGRKQSTAAGCNSAKLLS